MSLHDTPGVEPHQASATHALVVAQTSELLLQACGLGAAQSSQTRAGRVDSPEAGTTAAGELDPLMEQFTAVCITGHALL